MTEDEANALLPETQQSWCWMRIYSPGSIQIDGTLTLGELRAITVVMEQYAKEAA